MCAHTHKGAFLLECQMKAGQVLVFLGCFLLHQCSILRGIDNEALGYVKQALKELFQICERDSFPFLCCKHEEGSGR